MKFEKESNTTKQGDLSNWTYKEKENNNIKENIEANNFIKLNQKTKPRLAFGYGYDPNILKNGIRKFYLSHSLKDGLKLYEFTPKLPYRLFHILANILKYKCVGSEIKKGKTIIKNKYFITDGTPEQVINELNRAINTIFKLYDPIPNMKI